MTTSSNTRGYGHRSAAALADSKENPAPNSNADPERPDVAVLGASTRILAGLRSLNVLARLVVMAMISGSALLLGVSASASASPRINPGSRAVTINTAQWQNVARASADLGARTSDPQSGLPTGHVYVHA